MIDASAYQGETIGVFGLARSGLAVVAALDAGGAQVLAWDDAEERRAASLPLADLYAQDFADLDALCLSPGVPLTAPKPHPLAQKAAEADVPIIGDVEIFARARPGLPQHYVVGITGTNGKSTTTALLAHVLSSAGRQAVAAGNIGEAILAIEPLGEGGIYVLELSSFQIDLTHSLACDIAILLNISPDHLDRHGTMAGYVAAKRRLFEMQRPSGVAIASVDDAYARRLVEGLAQSVVPISAQGPVAGGCYAEGGFLIDDLVGEGVPAGRLDELPTLRGRHNWQNAIAAYAAARFLGVAPEAAFNGLRSFAGLAHRCEIVASHGGVTFINDSKASNADAAARALSAYDDIFWIAGGRAKEGGFAPVLAELENVRRAYLIGEAADVLAAELRGNVSAEICGTLETAVVAAARDAAESGGVVLLSPACASYDQFSDFEARGEAFRAAVGAVIGKGAA